MSDGEGGVNSVNPRPVVIGRKAALRAELRRVEAEADAEVRRCEELDREAAKLADEGKVLLNYDPEENAERIAEWEGIRDGYRAQLAELEGQTAGKARR